MGHKSKELAANVIEILPQIIHNIPISVCRDQSYDNARYMPGYNSGLQAKFREINLFSEYVPCVGHIYIYNKKI